MALVKEGSGHLRDDGAAADLVRSRESTLKGKRSRFINRKALEQWNGTSGVLFNYRWNCVRQFIKDLYAGLEAK